MVISLRNIESPNWKYDLWRWSSAGLATEATLAVVNIMLNEGMAPEYEAAGSGLFLTLARFGSATGFAILNAIPDSVNNHRDGEEGEQARFYAIERGLKAANVFCGASFIFGMLHQNPSPLSL